MAAALRLTELAIPPPGERIKNERRTWIWRQPLAGLPAGEHAVLKLYRHRGALAGLRSRWWAARVEREFVALERMQRHGLPCTEPLGWCCGRSAEHGRHELLATREIAGAVSLRRLAEDDPASAARLDLAALFRDTARLHRSGVFHGTLWASNILIVPGEGPASHHFSDPPRSVLYRGDIRGTAMARGDLLDLCHSVGQVLPLPPERLPLDAYGLEPAQRERLLARLRRYRPAKIARGLLRGMALLRSRAGRARLPRTG